MAGRGCRMRHPAEMEPRAGSAAPDRSPRRQRARWPEARQRQRPDLEIVGAEVSFRTSLSGLSIRLPRRRGKLWGYVSPPLGRRTVNTDPFPGSLVTVTSPPIMRASLRERARPSPVPPKRCAVVASAWLNSSKSFACCSGVIPMPVSETANSTKLVPLLTLRAASLTSPSLVNLKALLNKLKKRRSKGKDKRTDQEPIAHSDRLSAG